MHQRLWEFGSEEPVVSVDCSLCRAMRVVMGEIQWYELWRNMPPLGLIDPRRRNTPHQSVGFLVCDKYGRYCPVRVCPYVTRPCKVQCRYRSKKTWKDTDISMKASTDFFWSHQQLHKRKVHGCLRSSRDDQMTWDGLSGLESDSVHPVRHQ